MSMFAAGAVLFGLAVLGARVCGAGTWPRRWP